MTATNLRIGSMPGALEAVLHGIQHGGADVQFAALHALSFISSNTRKCSPPFPVCVCVCVGVGGAS